jgi:poly(A) polymerase Pap1
MNILISLYLQEEYAQFSIDEISQYFKDIQLEFTPEHQKIDDNDLRMALNQIKKYVIDEDLFYTTYNSPKLKLDNKKIDDIIRYIKSI